MNKSQVLECVMGRLRDVSLLWRAVANGNLRPTRVRTPGTMHKDTPNANEMNSACLLPSPDHTMPAEPLGPQAKVRLRRCCP